MEACCTCARLLSTVPIYSEKSEKLLPQDRQLECCGRTICGDCLHTNPRFETYCPYCQTTPDPSLLPPGLREPPAYTSTYPPAPEQSAAPDSPPPYTPHPPSNSLPPTRPAPPSEKEPLTGPEPVLHYLNHAIDTLPSLSLRYGVSISSIRSLNRLTSDHLLAARKAILIPADGASSSSSPSSSSTPITSLSPVPVESEEEEMRKNKIRRWMVATKVADYDVAVLYLEQDGYDLSGAIQRFLEDERWERDHPLDAGSRTRKKGKAVVGSGATGGVWARQAAFLRRGG